jgi:hypothetical protein
MNPQGFVSIHTLLISPIPIYLCLTPAYTAGALLHPYCLRHLHHHCYHHHEPIPVISLAALAVAGACCSYFPCCCIQKACQSKHNNTFILVLFKP